MVTNKEESIIKSLECCISYGDCAKQCIYFPDNGCEQELMREALELIKKIKSYPAGQELLRSLEV